MTISEPTTLLTDLVLAVAAATLGLRLFAAGRSPGRRATRLWAGAFLAGAVAALAGGIVHGFRPLLPPVGHAVLWKTVLAASGVACSLLVAGSAVAALRGKAYRACVLVTASALGVYLALVSRSDDVLLAAAFGAATIVALLGLGLAIARQDRGPLASLVAALALSAAGLAAQHARVPGPGPLNHNDVCHLLQTAALWPFYRAGRRLRDREAAVTGRRG